MQWDLLCFLLANQHGYTVPSKPGELTLFLSRRLEQELEQARSEIRRLEQAGTLADYVAKQDVRRQEIGQVTLVHALRMPNARDNT